MKPQYVLLICVVVAMATGMFLMYRKRRREATLRQVVRSHATTYMTSVEVNQCNELTGAESG